jgi:asparagine synthase (glutamine-hydrolysing)
MSTFFGVFNPCGNLDHVAFDQMKSAIHRNGYDELETYIDDKIAMGHLMLKVTPESFYDKQPLKSDCGRYIVVGHFRLDYRDELADKLGLTQKELEQTPDSYLVMKSLQKWGKKCVYNLNGDWSFVYFDNLKNQLFVGKDSTGISSVFYININGSIFFSSDPCIFSKSHFFKPELDETQFIYFSVKGLNMDMGKTLYKNLRCLQNGTFVVFGEKLENNVNRYFDIFSIKCNRLYKFDADLFFELKSIYVQAVKSRCRSDFEIGLFLSSGLDSMSVAAVGAQELNYQKKQLHTFTSAPSISSKLTADEMAYADESNLVKKGIANFKNINASFCRFEDFKFSEIDFDEVGLDPFNPYVTVNYFWINGVLQLAKTKGIRSVLTGQMGNFTISSDGFMVHLEFFKKLMFSKLFRELFLFATNKKISISKAFKIRVLQVFKYQLKTLIKSNSKFSQSFFKEYGVLNYNRYYKNKSIFKSKRNELIPDYFFIRSQRKLRLKQLEKTLFFSNSYWYSYSMLNGVEVLDPTSDERVICFSLSIQEHKYFSEGIRKYIYKGVFAGLVNKYVLENTVYGVQSYDFGDRLTTDTKSIQWLSNYQIDKDEYNSQFYKHNLEKLIFSEKPNFKRTVISKVLHFISVHNFSRNFKKAKFVKTTV